MSVGEWALPFWSDQFKALGVHRCFERIRGMDDESVKHVPRLDAHAHLTEDRFWPKVARESLKQALDSGTVDHVIFGGTHPLEWARQIELKAHFGARVSLVVGLHPWWILDRSDQEIDHDLGLLESLLADHSHPIFAVGETGLDFFRAKTIQQKKAQEHAFRFQIKLAQSYHKPFVVHAVRSVGRCLEILREEVPFGLMSGWPVLWHRFSGSFDQAQEILKHTDSIFSFRPQDIKKPTVISVWNQLPPDRRLLESDGDPTIF